MSLKTRLESQPQKTSIIAQEKDDTFHILKGLLQNRVIDDLEIDFSELGDMTETIKTDIKRLINEHVEQEAINLTITQKQRLKDELMDEITGFGPITGLLNDPEISEVMVNGPYQVYVEKKGCLSLSEAKFKDNNHVLHVIKKIVSPIGRRIDESSPMVDARLPDGSRVNAIIPPLALDGPVITIRKFSEDPYRIDDLIGFGTLTSQMAELIRYCILGRLNVIVSGGTGSGKTTTLNVLSSFIPEDERIVTIEDAAELQLGHGHVVRLETRPPNIDGRGEVTSRDLVRNALRMRPDRIILGEVRGNEVMDVLQAMNTGHDGCMSTLHANSPRDALVRMEMLAGLAGFQGTDLTLKTMISTALDIIVQISRTPEGKRRITAIEEVQGLRDGQFVTSTLYEYRIDNDNFINLGILPTVVKLRQDGGWGNKWR